MDEGINPAPGPVRSVYHKPKPFWRSKKMLIILAVIVFAFLGWFFFIRDTSVPGSKQTKTLTIAGTPFAVPGNWQPLQTTDADKKAGVLLKLGSSKPTGSIVWRILKGKLAKNVDIPALPDKIAVKLSSGFKDTKIISKELTKVGSFDAVKIVYTRPDTNDSSRTNRNLMYVVPRPNQTHYLTFSAQEGDFAKLEPGFAKILTSFVTYSTAHP